MRPRDEHCKQDDSPHPGLTAPPPCRWRASSLGCRPPSRGGTLPRPRLPGHTYPEKEEVSIWGLEAFFPTVQKL